MDKSEQRENMTKRSVTKNTWLQLVNYSYLQKKKKSLGHVKDKIISLFKINTTKDHSKPTSSKNLYGGAKKPRKLKNKLQIT